MEDVSSAASIAFIDGHDYPDSGTRMLTELQGYVQVPDPNCIAPCLPLTQPTPGTTFYFVQYPATLGLLDGPGAATGDQSVTAAQQDLQKFLHDPRTVYPVTVTAYSEGAVAASHEVANWAAGSGVAFVLIADPERPNGGILARFPAGTYIPLIGITAGNATPSGGAPVVMVTRQYDGVADAPVYVGNVLADLNAFLGFYYLHSTYYSVNPNDPTNIVTTSADGTMTDILVPAAPGALPIFMPLAQAGVPQPVLVALDPLARAIIETGYLRTTDPSQQVMFAFLPPPSAWSADAQAIAAGFTLTAQELPAVLAASFPGLPGLPAPLPVTALASSPSPATTTLNTSAVSQTSLSSQLQSTPQGQQQITNPANTAGTELVQQNTSTPATLSTKVSAPRPTVSQTVTAAAKTDTNGDATDMTGGNQVKPDQEPPTNPTKHATGVLENVQQRVTTPTSHAGNGLTNASEHVDTAGPTDSAASTGTVR